MFGCSSDNNEEDVVAKSKNKVKGYAVSTEGVVLFRLIL